MTNLRKAAEMALAKLDHLWEIGIDAEYKVELLPEIHALRQALAQPEQTPVAYVSDDGASAAIVLGVDLDKLTPLYTAPPKSKWVGLTDEEVDALLWKLSLGAVDEDVRTIEAKLKEKNS